MIKDTNLKKYRTLLFSIKTNYIFYKKSFLLRSFLIVMLLQSIFIYNLTAQNNPYKIDDECYKLFVTTRNLNDKSKYEESCDKLFNIAKKKNDLKAQCIAWDLRCINLAKHNDTKNLEKALEKIKQFITPTPYKQYLYHCWGLLSSCYINDNMGDKALNELAKLRDHALAHNYMRGVSQAYTSMGILYHNVGAYNMAENSYRKALEALKNSDGNLNPYDLESKLAWALAAMNKKEEAMYYFEQSIRHVPNDMRFSPASLYASFLVDNAHLFGIEKIDSIIHTIMKYRSSLSLSALGRDRFYTCVSKYFSLKKNWQKALTYSDSISEEANLITARSLLYKEKQQWDSAYVYINKHIQYNKDRWSEINSFNMANLIARSDSARFQYENQKLRIKELEANEKLQNAEILKNQLELKNGNLELQAQQQTMQLNESESRANKLALERQRQITEKMLVEKRATQERNIIYIGVLMVLLTTSAIVLYIVNRSRRRIKREKAVTLEALSEAEQARIRAEQADSLKSLFLQNMSHEIRTPLNAIVGFNEVLNGESADLISLEEKKEYVDIINTNSNLLTTLINDILDISKLESGTYKLELSDINIEKLCKESLSSINGKQKANVKLNLSISKEIANIKLHSDSARIQQVITNFLTNACKNTENGSITLAARVSVMKDGTPCIRFEVTDTGCGIPKEAAEKIFSRFEKLNNFKQGTGLGLNICKMISDLVHGCIYLDSTYEWKGSRFVFEHPLT